MDHLLALYQKRLDLQNATFSPVDHEDATVALVYEVTLSSGVQLILKICSHTRDYLREVYFLRYFSGKLPVPRMIQTVAPEANLHGAILMDRLPGMLLKKADFSDELAYEMGSLLASIHLNRLSGYGDLTEPERLNLDPRVHFTFKFEEGLEECSQHLPHSLIEQCRLYYDRNLNLLTSVDGPCMIHRDFRAGNVIVSDGKIQGIIDWSSARASFAEDDFCPMEHGEWPSNPKNKASFLAGYANVRPVPNYTTLMPLLRLSRAVATVGFTVKRGIWADSGSRMYQFNRRFLEAFF